MRPERYAALIFLLLAGCQTMAEVKVTPTELFTPTATHTATFTPTITSTPIETLTPTSTPTKAPTPKPTPSIVHVDMPVPSSFGARFLGYTTDYPSSFAQHWPHLRIDIVGSKENMYIDEQIDLLSAGIISDCKTDQPDLILEAWGFNNGNTQTGSVEDIDAKRLAAHELVDKYCDAKNIPRIDMVGVPIKASPEVVDFQNRLTVKLAQDFLGIRGHCVLDLRDPSFNIKEIPMEDDWHFNRPNGYNKLGDKVAPLIVQLGQTGQCPDIMKPETILKRYGQ